MLRVKLGNHDLIKKRSVGAWILLLWLLNDIILSISRFLLTRMNIYGFIRNSILLLLTMIPIAFFSIYMKQIGQRKYRFFLGIYFVIILAFFFTYLINPDIAYFYEREDYGLQRVFRPDGAIYALLFFSLCDNTKELYDIVKKYAYIDFGYLLVFQFLPAYMGGGWADIGSNGTMVVRQYSLSFGYAMLLPVIVFLYLYIKHKKIYYLIFSFVGGVLIFTNGSRGALLMLALFIGLMMISNIVESPKASYKILKIGSIIVLILILFVFGETLLRSFVNFAQDLGIQSRTLDLLLSGDISSDTGRDVIWAAVIDAIKNGGIFGHGVFGERPYVFPIHYAAYSHNIVLELVCSFGIIGVGVCIFLIVGTLRMIFFCKDTQMREIFIIFFSVASQLFLSLSFWYVWEFWAAIAIAHRYFQTERKRKLNG